MTPSMTVAGTAKVVRFNWPKYVAVVLVVTVLIVARGERAPAVAHVGLWIAAVLGVAWTVSSLLATWWVYDHRRVYGQVTAGLGDVGAWSSVHAGFDDATPILANRIGRRPVGVFEVSVPGRSSLSRARAAEANRNRGCSVAALPLESGTLDAVFLTFAVHEVRDPAEQRRLFAELHRVLAPGGRLVVTEHLRDVANGIVYGPGSLHFQTGRVWRRRAAEVGLRAETDVTITPFVHRMVWRR